ncbi:hypothetical protein [Brachybacterium sp. AOP29-B2-41]
MPKAADRRPEDASVVVVGASVAGLAVAEFLRRPAAAITLVE